MQERKGTNDNYIKNNKGITLIALVVTVVVLIILAVISLNMVFNENAMIRQAEKAKEHQINAEMNDNEMLESMNNEIKESVEGNRIPEEEKYVKEGLILHFDGIDNTENGHDNNSTIWKDLSGNNNDGELKNFEYTQTSGWTEGNGLQLDGANDGIFLGDKLTDLFQTENTVQMILKVDESSARDILIGNYSRSYSNNYEIATSKRFRVWFNNGKVSSYTPSNTTISNENFSISVDYQKQASKVIYYQNNLLTYTVESDEFKTYNYPYNNVWIGRDSRTGSTCLKGKIYAVRIYNRSLTEEEQLKNYEQDKIRFGI